MCGIFALLHPGKQVAEATLQAALDSLRHRGPDDRGLWRDIERDVVLGQTRLAIQDVSAAGHQPMVSASGRFVITFNGEIYNHQAIRAMLEPVGGGAVQAQRHWRGHSDTETLLAAIDEWGLETTLRRIVGMFAFCLWDRQSREMHLARDRIGEKPLYYGYAGGVFAVASEVRAFRVLPEFDGRIDRRSLALMMRFLAVPAPHCIFQGFSTLLPGTYLTINADNVRRSELPDTKVYWSAASEAHSLGSRPFDFASDAEAVDSLERCLGSAVRRQMTSDVPLGAFLSGGIDSSLVVALMQAEARRAGADPIKTFSIGFSQADYNEAPHAKRVATHLGTSHTELYVSNAECLALVPRLSGIYDEPFADSSQIGVYLVSRMARESVTVALTGDGGDELFGGYNRYTQGARWWRQSGRIPKPISALMRTILARIPPDAADRTAKGLSRMLPTSMQIPRPSDRLQKLVHILSSRDARQLFTGFVEHWRPSEIMLEPVDTHSAIEDTWSDFKSIEEQMMMLDLSFILPTDMLTKVDRAAMSVSLETRVPFLDPSVMEFAWRLPLSSKIRGGEGKWLLRQLLYRHVPASIVERPKMGFNVPIARWLKGPLRDWADALLDESRLRDEGLFNVAAVRNCWHEHLYGKNDHSHRLWSVLMFQSWREAGHSDQAMQVG